MTNILFLDETGNPIKVVSGGPIDPEKYIDPKLPEKFTWKIITEKEKHLLFPAKGPERNGNLPDPPHEQIMKFKKIHDALIDSLEEIFESGISIKKGDLKQMISQKTGKK